jgi:integrase
MRTTDLPGRHFKSLRRSADLPTIGLNDLRHTYATILVVARKHPKLVQELLGHRSTNITLETHPRVIEGDGRRAGGRYGRSAVRLYYCRIAATGVYGLTPMVGFPLR